MYDTANALQIPPAIPGGAGLYLGLLLKRPRRASAPKYLSG